MYLGIVIRAKFLLSMRNRSGRVRGSGGGQGQECDSSYIDLLGGVGKILVCNFEEETGRL
jgi:hypothetical protein